MDARHDQAGVDLRRLVALLLLTGTPAFAANDGQVTILRGEPAPPQPWYEPPPQPVVVEYPVVYPPVYYYVLPARRFPAHPHHRHFRR